MAGSSATDSQYNNFSFERCDTMTVKYCTDTTIRSPIVTTVTTDNTANRITVYGNVTTVSGAWTNSQVIGSLDFLNSQGASGYTYLPGGLILQWLVCSGIGTGSTNFNLPIAFPNNNFGVIGLVGDTTGSLITVNQVSGSHTLSSINIYASTGSSTAKAWVIGN
jgi:hypothetical protein